MTDVSGIQVNSEPFIRDCFRFFAEYAASGSKGISISIVVYRGDGCTSCTINLLIVLPPCMRAERGRVIITLPPRPRREEYRVATIIIVRSRFDVKYDAGRLC